MQDPLETYASNLLQAKGVPVTTENLNSLLQEINDAIDQSILESLPLNQLDKLEAATDSGQVDDNLIENLLAEANIDPQLITNQTLADFKNQYLKEEK